MSFGLGKLGDDSEQISSCWKLGLVSFLVISGAVVFSSNCSLAQIVPDKTLGDESSIVTPNVNTNGIPSDRIDGGAIRGTNLFHSFKEFNVDAERGAYFTSPAGIKNILSRITGTNPSKILGTLGVVKGNANLFLINPNGIIFGPNASLDLKGSFLASTANSLNFGDGVQFSTDTSQTAPLLTVSVPVGLQFGATAKPIRNQSQASPNGKKNSFGFPVGLQVETGKTIALVGGDVTLEGGNLTAQQGRVELGSVAGNSSVSLNPTENGWVLGYEGVQNFQNIQLAQRINSSGNIQSLVDASGEGGGDIQVQGKQVILTDGSQIFSITQGAELGGNLTVNASEEVKLIGSSYRGSFSGLSSITTAAGDAGNITINTRRLLIQDGAGVTTESVSVLEPTTGQGGNLTINASGTVELIGTDTNGIPSSLLASTQSAGNAGDITIKTGRLLLKDGAQVSAFTRGEGRGGTLTVNASDSAQLSGEGSGLSSETSVAGDAGDVKIATGNFIVRDGAETTVKSEGTGDAGNLDVKASSIRLENGGQLTATSESGKGGGNIKLNNQGLLLLRGNGEISTNAGGEGNGGNINIDTDILAATDKSNITAKAKRGRGGNIQIATQGFFVSPDSSINADSEQGINGVVEINRPDIDPNAELVTLPAQIVDVNGLVASGCPAGGGNLARGTGEFVVTGRGGLPPNPAEVTRSDTVLADLGRSVQSEENRNNTAIASNNVIAASNTSAKSTTLVEASGWVIGSKGEVILTANNPTFTSDIPWLKSNSCNGS